MNPRSSARKLPARNGAAAAVSRSAPDPFWHQIKTTLESMVVRVRDRDRQTYAQTVTRELIVQFWHEAVGGGVALPAVPDMAEWATTKLDDAERDAIGRFGSLIGCQDTLNAAFAIGSVYASLLPKAVRAERGVYYTPPPLAERLIQLTSAAGIDWGTATVLDPGCGGGSFLIPVIRRVRRESRGVSKERLLHGIETRIQGYEIDPFAAWMTQVFLEAELADLWKPLGRRLARLVRVRDSLEAYSDPPQFDLVIGNPPYGRITLSVRLREQYTRSLYGHANLYGLFTDLAVRLAIKDGIVAYVTPTSFLSGQYFKSLREMLSRIAPLVFVDLVDSRNGVFEGVLQETLLAVYRKNCRPKPAPVSILSSNANGEFTSRISGTFTVPSEPSQPWVMPRTGSHGALVRRLRTMPHTLADYGYSVKTGPLVWNRHKSQLQSRMQPGCYPLIWAESVTSDGRFEFRANRRNHSPFFNPGPGDEWLIFNSDCVLLQRTTAKEQLRRLIAAELPASFVKEFGGVVVENHLNMIRPTNGKAGVSPAGIAALFNSSVVDEVFRCMNGSVAVSAFELECLPMPPPAQMRKLDSMIHDGAPREEIDRLVRGFYEQG